MANKSLLRKRYS